MKLFLIVLTLFVSTILLQAQNMDSFKIENIQIGYEENALFVTWESQDTLIYDRFHIFYAEAQIEHINLLDSVLYWGMSLNDCWDWEIAVNAYEYFFVLPKRVFPAYTSLIRIGIIGEHWFGNQTSIYSKLFLAPDIVNKTPQAPENIILEVKILGK